MSKLPHGRATIAALAACLLIYSGSTLAELIPITLAGLVQEASFVAYGSSARGSGAAAPSSTVRFQPVSVLKGKSLIRRIPWLDHSLSAALTATPLG
jgi:hypothetical protein